MVKRIAALNLHVRGNLPSPKRGVEKVTLIQETSSVTYRYLPHYPALEGVPHIEV